MESKVKENTKPNNKVTKKTSKKKNRGKAFTLIELLAVIIILGVIMVIAIPSVTTYIQNSRKASYVASAKTISDGAKTLVNSGELPVYDLYTTYYIPEAMISTENAKTSPYGDFKDAYVVVTYEKDGYDYYWTSSDTANMGINLTYYDKLDKSGVVPNMEGDPTNIAICGKERIVVFNEEGGVKEEKVAEDCIEPRGIYIKEDLTNCEYTLTTDYGSFSTSGVEKEICVKLIDDYSYDYYSYFSLSGRWTAGANAVLNVQFSKSEFTPSSYVRVYNNSNKEVLLGEVTYADYPKYTRTVSYPTNDVVYSINKNLGELPSSGAYYIEMSSDIAAKNNGNVMVLYGTLYHHTEIGPWLYRQKDLNKVETLVDSIYDIEWESYCDNPSPRGGLLYEGFDREGNTFKADVRLYCDGIPK